MSTMEADGRDRRTVLSRYLRDVRRVADLNDSDAQGREGNRLRLRRYPLRLRWRLATDSLS